jgi:hypothetical protein
MNTRLTGDRYYFCGKLDQYLQFRATVKLNRLLQFLWRMYLLYLLDCATFPRYVVFLPVVKVNTHILEWFKWQLVVYSYLATRNAQYAILQRKCRYFVLKLQPPTPCMKVFTSRGVWFVSLLLSWSYRLSQGRWLFRCFVRVLCAPPSLAFSLRQAA